MNLLDGVSPKALRGSSIDPEDPDLFAVGLEEQAFGGTTVEPFSAQSTRPEVPERHLPLRKVRDLGVATLGLFRRS